MLRGILAIALCVVAPCVHAQDAANDADAKNAGDATTLDTVRVTAPRPDMIDLYKFKNPIEVEGSAFDKYYRAPPTPEEVSMQGGYILLGITYGLMKAAEQVTKLPGWKDQIQPATARPPPLDDAQAQKAARLTDAPALQSPPPASVDATQASPGTSLPR